jgi:trans-aconitate 2-methyltransferase
VENGKVLGIDSCNSMLEFAKNKFPSSIYSNLDFQYGNAQDFNFNSQFDLIVSFDCLHSMLNHFPILLNIHRSLKDNGKIVLGFRGKDQLTAIIDNSINSRKWKPRLENKVEYNFCETEIYSSLLRKSGFKPQKIEIHKSIVTHYEKMGLLKQIKNQWFSLSSRLRMDLYEEFVNDLVEVYLQLNPPDRNGIIDLQEAWLEIEATKEMSFN